MNTTRGRTDQRPARAPWRAVLLAIAVVVVSSCSPAPSVTADTHAIDFGFVSAGTDATPKTIDVAVRGFLPDFRGLLRATVDDPAGPFTIDSFECPVAEDVDVPGQLPKITCHLTIGFHPTTDGTYTGNARILALFFPVDTVALSGSTSPSPVLAEVNQAILLPLVGLGCVGAWLLINRRRARRIAFPDRKAR